MTWKPIIAGVDDTPESVYAAVAAAAIAQRARTDCHLVSAVPDYARMLESYGMVRGTAEAAREAVERDRARICQSIGGYVPQALCAALQMRTGRAPLVLEAAARRLDAGLIVLGSKQHHGLDRLRRSTVTWLARACDVPLFVTNGSSLLISRVLAAVDLSHAAAPTLAAARRWARLFDADLRILHVAEPMLTFPGVQEPRNGHAGLEQWLRTSGRLVELDARAEKVMRRGDATTAIEREAIDWSADLLVVGSHGKGWVDRLLLGSTTENLLSRPPALMLVVPVGPPQTANAAAPAADARIEAGAAAEASR